MPMELEQLNRIEQKLDKIIKFFNICRESRRSNQELERLAKETVAEWKRDGKLKLLNNKLIAK